MISSGVGGGDILHFPILSGEVIKHTAVRVNNHQSLQEISSTESLMKFIFGECAHLSHYKIHMHELHLFNSSFIACMS